MKLPERSERGVERLGREDTAAIAAKGRAQQNLANAAVDASIAVAQRVSSTEFNEGYTLAKNSINDVKDKIARTKTLKINEVPPGVEIPEGAVRKVYKMGPDGEPLKDRAGNKIVDYEQVNMLDIGDRYFAVESKRILEDTLNNAASRNAKNRLDLDVTQNLISPTAEAVNEYMYAQRLARDRAISDESIDVAVNTGDEQLAIQVVGRGFANGIYDEADTVTKINEIGEAIDIRSHVNAIEGATTGEQLDEIRNAIVDGIVGVDPETGEKTVKPNRYDVGKMTALLTRVRQRETALAAAWAAAQEQNYGELLVQSVSDSGNGSGTPEYTQDVVDAILSGEIDPDKGNILLNKIDSGVSQSKIDNLPARNIYMEKAGSIGNTFGGKFSIAYNAKAVRDSAIMAATGFNSAGDPVDIPPESRLSGNDLTTILTKVKTFEEMALRNNDGYRNALNQLSRNSGLSLDITGNLMGQLEEGDPRVEAFLMQKKALDRHMNEYGNQAQPMVMAAQLEKDYTKEKMSEAQFPPQVTNVTKEMISQARLKSNFPVYADPQFQTPSGGLNKQAVAKDLYRRLYQNDPRAGAQANDRISRSALERAIWDLYGEYTVWTVDEMRNLENPEEFYESIEMRKQQGGIYKVMF